LTQVGGSKTKVDGTNGSQRYSFKKAKSSSTQIHITTQNHFIKLFNLGGECEKFVKHFFGDLSFTNKERCRFKCSDLPKSCVNSFFNFLTENKEKVVDYFVSGDSQITDFVYNDYHITYSPLMKKLTSSDWHFTDTAMHLKNREGKTLLHIQMKGSGAGKTKHSILVHIHQNAYHD
jgi:hypothetical protein